EGGGVDPTHGQILTIETVAVAVTDLGVDRFRQDRIHRQVQDNSTVAAFTRSKYLCINPCRSRVLAAERITFSFTNSCINCNRCRWFNCDYLRNGCGVPASISVGPGSCNGKA